MDEYPRGLRPHTHEQRRAMVDRLLPLWQQKFGDNLLAVAVCASYARGADLSFSDLEFEVFLHRPVGKGEDRYLQRIVDGMLVEALYDTEESYLSRRVGLTADWPLSASETLVALYNAPFIEALNAKLRALQYPLEAFLLRAAHRFYEAQEASGKVLSAIEVENRDGLPLLLFDAVMHMLAVLALINQTPYTTFASMISQARRFPIQPAGFGELLNLVVGGRYTNLPRTREALLAVVRGFEQWFDQVGQPLYDQSIDPNLPNRSYMRQG